MSEGKIRPGALFREKVRTVIDREAVTLAEFIGILQDEKPAKVFYEGWSKTPLFELSNFTQHGCDYVCNGYADRTRRRIAYRDLYKKMKNGMSTAYFR